MVWVNFLGEAMKQQEQERERKLFPVLFGRVFVVFVFWGFLVRVFLRRKLNDLGPTTFFFKIPISFQDSSS